jgi:hypothetical protein
MRIRRNTVVKHERAGCESDKVLHVKVMPMMLPNKQYPNKGCSLLCRNVSVRQAFIHPHQKNSLLQKICQALGSIHTSNATRKVHAEEGRN